METPIYINKNLIVSSSFRDFLFIGCKINQMIMIFETLPEVNFLSPTDKIDTVSYLPLKRIEYTMANGLDPFDDKSGRVHIKVGRLIFKLFNKQLLEEYINDSDIEYFVNQYKAFFDRSNKKIIVVEGEDIRKYYLDRNYDAPDQGTLWKSCMRYRERQEFLDIYVKNPDKVKMLVMLNNREGFDRVMGRALLWESVEDFNDNRLKVMDRIYTIFDSDVLIFKKWARDNGYITKAYQNAKTQNIFEVDNHEIVMDLKVTLENHLLGSYPYLDSFQFYDQMKGIFYNSTKRSYDYTLIQSNGSPYPLDPEPEEEPNFDDEVMIDDAEW
jgi:hypothetical protein